MEGKLNPLQQLDAVLKYLNSMGSVFEHIKKNEDNKFDAYKPENDGINSLTFELILNEFKGKITEVHLKKVLKKLHNDTYIDIENDQYSISWEGVLFILLDEGYENKRALNKKFETELKILQKQGLQMAKHTVWLTALLTLCGVIASLYYLLEIAKFSLSLHCLN